MPRNLIPQDQGTTDDTRGRRKPNRPDELRSGTLFGQYQLRGSILTIKDSSTTASGFMSFSDSMTNAPTSSSSGTGLYIDYTGIYGLSGGTKQFYWTTADGKGYAGAGAVIIDSTGTTYTGANGDGSSTAYLKFINGGGTQIGKIIAEYGTGTDAGAASGVWTYGYSDTSGRTGNVGWRAIPFGGGSTGPGLDLYSTGRVAMDLRNGSDLTNSTQALTISSQTSGTASDNTALYIDSYSSGAVANGFGTAMVMRAEDSAGNMIDQVKLVGSWKDKTAGTADAYFQLSVSQNSSYNAVMAINKSGNYSIGGSGITHTPTYFIDINDGNDLQANIRADASAQNDDGWATAAIDYGEFVEKQDYTEALGIGDIVFIKGRKASKRGKGTPMIVSTYAGIRGGEPMQWGGKWMPEAEYTASYGDAPTTIAEWEAKYGKQVKRDVEGKPQPREPFDVKPDGRFILNPAWNPDETYTPRSYRTEEWIVVAFAGQVPVKVRGKVIEGDYIIPSGKNDGYGKAGERKIEHFLDAVGVAWGDKTDEGEGTVMVAVGVK